MTAHPLPGISAAGVEAAALSRMHSADVGLPAQDIRELKGQRTSGGRALILGPGARIPATPITPNLPQSFGHHGNLCAFWNTCPHNLGSKATFSHHHSLLP